MECPRRCVARVARRLWRATHVAGIHPGTVRLRRQCVPHHHHPHRRLCRVRDTISIAADGGWTYTPKVGTSTGGTLAAADLAQIVTAVANPAFARELAPHKDIGYVQRAFTYSVSLGGETPSFEEGCGTAGDRPLFDQLMTLLTARTPF